MELFDIYKDIQVRTNGEIYLGVVGPVRTGKSTFIKRFMDLMVLPKMTDLPSRERARDELPQSASGKTVMTAEPKFVPNEAAEISVMDDIKVKVRLVDCVGYMVDGATGHMENEEERKVKTPWFDYEVPFTKAASIGTQKVIEDHATIGIVVTTDGSIGELKRESYLPAEEKTIQELQAIGKPFIVLVNSQKPYSPETKQLVQQLKDTYSVSAMAINCEQMREEDIHHVMEEVLKTFPVSEIGFYLPKWVEMLPRDHKIKQAILKYMKGILGEFQEIRNVSQKLPEPTDEYIDQVKIESVAMDTGVVCIRIQVKECYYYEMLSGLTDTNIQNEYELVKLLKQLSKAKREYEAVEDAICSVKMKGYGVVNPQKSEITLEEPVIIKQGNKFGVKIHSTAPSIHMIRANIETEIAPIIGSEEQAKDLVKYIGENARSEEGIWGTSIFGKSIEDMVMDGMRNKLIAINDESQVKLQDTMQKIVNDSNGGMVCIII